MVAEVGAPLKTEGPGVGWTCGGGGRGEGGLGS